MASTEEQRLLYLGTRDIQALALTPRVVCDALAEGFANHAAGRFNLPPKQSLVLGPGHFFQSLSVTGNEGGHAATKWVGLSPGNAARGLANVNGLIVLSDVETGVPLAVMDANLLTVARTAGMSALGARYLARADSKSIGFVGCGQQARGNLLALRDVLPGLEHAVTYSASSASAQDLAGCASQLGMSAHATLDSEEVLGCDVIVTSVSGGPALKPFLDASRLRPGAFVAAVDLGRSWRPETLDQFDLKVTDDRSQADDPANRSKLAFKGRFDADLAELVSNSGTGRQDARQKTLLLFPGFALGDLVIASLAYHSARNAGIGTWLPR